MQATMADERTITLYRGNRVDGEHRMTFEEITTGFLQSEYGEDDFDCWTMDRRLRAYLTSPKYVNSVWGTDGDEGEYPALLSVVLDRYWNTRETR